MGSRSALSPSTEAPGGDSGQPLQTKQRPSLPRPKVSSSPHNPASPQAAQALPSCTPLFLTGPLASHLPPGTSPAQLPLPRHQCPWSPSSPGHLPPPLQPPLCCPPNPRLSLPVTLLKLPERKGQALSHETQAPEASPNLPVHTPPQPARCLCRLWRCQAPPVSQHLPPFS